MLLSVLLMAVSAWGACPQTVFEFQGQPDCVAVVYAPPHITLTNACTDPILIDASVQLGSGASSGVVMPGSALKVQDLSYFSLGMKGQIFPVVALVSQTDEACGDSSIGNDATENAGGQGDTADVDGQVEDASGQLGT